AGRGIEQEHVARLGELRDRVDHSAVTTARCQVRRWRQVPIPDVVADELEMPNALAGPRLERDEGVGEQVVSRAVSPIVVVGRRARGYEHQAALDVERHPGPVIGSAGIRPRAVRPRLVPELAGAGNRMEGPAE